MKDKKSYNVKPEEGVFYLIPNPQTGKYTIYSQHGPDALHVLLWDSICTKLQMSWKINEVLFKPYYTGLPRGRIIEPYNWQDDWIVGIGGDFPLNEYRSMIINEFNLEEADSLGKVKFEIQTHEKMTSYHKKTVEDLLDIKMTPRGFTKVVKKKA